ncbi:MAG: P-type conjugative transfer protein VirB9 [Alphaproteobacteria bacterium]|nr:MAG: P-type conjugative transfer protein VirB9 [Alphaproteobacteria bacterium]
MSPQILCAAALVLAGLVGTPVVATEIPAAGQYDARLRTLDYNPLDVVRVEAWFGYQIMFEFAEDEHIENVALGDSMSWQVTPNKAGNLMFIKPVTVPAVTNMTVVTDRRRYHFEMVGMSGEPTAPEDLTFNIRFHYPADEAAKAAVEAERKAAEADSKAETGTSEPLDTATLNFDFRFKGDKSNLPDRLFDDGKATYLYWAKNRAMPALFTVGDDGKETVINFTVRGDYMVLDQCVPELLLRNGRQETRLFNMRLYDRKRGKPVPQSGAMGR